MSAQQSSTGPKHGLWCHGPQDADTGLWCSTINTHFVPQQGTGYTTSIQFLQNGIIPITGTMTFAPEGQVLYGSADDYDAYGNPVCYQKDAYGNYLYDANGNLIVVACQMQYDYGMIQWDITAGPAHFVYDP